jgi:hypothetical protein
MRCQPKPPSTTVDVDRKDEKKPTASKVLLRCPTYNSRNFFLSLSLFIPSFDCECTYISVSIHHSQPAAKKAAGTRKRKQESDDEEDADHVFLFDESDSDEVFSLLSRSPS